jgi:Domain of unknown function (DUF397)
VISHDRFRTSSYSGGVNCVEVRLLPDGRIALRDSKDQSLPPHHFTATEWTAFLAGVRAGEFDLDGGPHESCSASPTMIPSGPRT